MIKYILKRIGFTILAMFILLTLLFFLMKLIPGYPFEQDPKETVEQFQQKLASYNLDKDVFSQYFLFWKNLFEKGEFGVIYNEAGIPTIEKFMQPVKYTLLIALPAFVISSILGVFLGIVASYFRSRWQDTLINIFSVIFISIPSFILALYLIQFAGLIKLPTNFVVPDSDGFTTEKMILSLIMPILSMVLASTSTIVYFTRNEMVEVMKQEYIRTALGKGLKFRSVIFKHGLRNAFIPILYALLPSLLSVLSGSIIIEKFFNVPGTASLIVYAVQKKETFILMFSALFYSGIYFLLQIAFDVISTFIDPRIKLGESSSKSFYKQIKSFFARRNDNGLAIGQNVLANNTIQVKNNINLLTFSNKIKNNITINEKIDFDPNKPIVKCENITQISESKFKIVDIESINKFDNISGKPTKQWFDILKRFISNKAALVFSIIFFIIVLLSIFIPIFGQPFDEAISDKITTLGIYLPPRIPWLGLNGEISMVVSSEKFEALKVSGAIIRHLEVAPGIYNVTYNPYLINGLKNIYPIFGTDANGRDWWNMMWISTSQSLILAIIVSAISTFIGSVYGSIAGFNAGKPIDNIMMRIVEIISGVPTIVWILVFSLVFSLGILSPLTIAISLIIVSWIWPAMSTRVFIMKYKDVDYIEASRSLGASNSRLIFVHLLPNVLGKLMVRFVNQIPNIIFFETSLVFLGLVLPNQVGLGSMIEIARQSGYFYLLIGPTFIIVIITLCAQIIANAFNDALDPKVSGDK